MLRFQNGWILRKSLHDPQIPINIESDLEGGATALSKGYGFLESFEALEFRYNGRIYLEKLIK